MFEDAMHFFEHDTLQIGLPVFFARLTIITDSSLFLSPTLWLQALGLSVLAVANSRQLPSIYEESVSQPNWYWNDFAPLLSAEAVVLILSMQLGNSWILNISYASLAGVLTWTAIHAKYFLQATHFAAAVAAAISASQLSMIKKSQLGRWGFAGAVGTLIYAILPAACMHILPVAELSDAYRALAAFHDEDKFRSAVIRLLLVTIHIQVFFAVSGAAPQRPPAPGGESGERQRPRGEWRRTKVAGRREADMGVGHGGRRTRMAGGVRVERRSTSGLVVSVRIG